MIMNAGRFVFDAAAYLTGFSVGVIVIASVLLFSTVYLVVDFIHIKLIQKN